MHRGSALFLLCLVLLVAAAPATVRAQVSNWSGPHTKAQALQPEVRIPVTSLGYMQPGELPAFSYYSLVALHFIDSSHLLFSFNITGLLTRSAGCNADSDGPEDVQRLVRTVVLRLPSGKVEKKTEWQLHDYAHYLWELNNGQFLFRRCSQLGLLGPMLDERPLVKLDGEMELLDQSPDRLFLLLEVKKKIAKTTTSGGTGANIFAGTSQFLQQTKLREIDVVFLRLDPLGVIAHSRTQAPADLPVLPAGFLEVTDQTHDQWQVDLQPYQGKLQGVVQIHSACPPQLEALTDSTFLAIVCKDYSETALLYQAYDLRGEMLWQQPMPAGRISPQFEYAANRSRMAVATLHTTHQVAALDPLNSQDVDGQIIDVYEVQTGKHLLSFRTTPVYTAGQNFALSPNGDRLAVLHDGAIEIYNLNTLPQVPSVSRH
ncbi:MAG: hypothetical protein ACP5EP_08165 [Acidobacteriaceae bacterium]